MGHSIPAPFAQVFVNLMHARDKGLITMDQGHKTWGVVCDAWKKRDPESYEDDSK
jgi:hypothetical protein